MELAVVATPARSVPDVVEECGQVGVEGVVIISAGFKEIGEEGIRLESEIDRIRKKYGMRILGPNCVGFVRPVLGLNATFLRRYRKMGRKNDKGCKTDYESGPDVRRIDRSCIG